MVEIRDGSDDTLAHIVHGPGIDNPLVLVEFNPSTGAETGRFFYHTRFYDSAVGSFISVDPIGLSGSLNTYGYVDQAPIQFVDPYGLELYIPDLAQAKTIEDVIRILRREQVLVRNSPTILVTHLTIGDSLCDIPSVILDWKPKDVWGRNAQTIGDHLWNHRLPQGFHLTQEEKGGPIFIHHDYFNPLDGAWATARHKISEVDPIRSGKTEQAFLTPLQPGLTMSGCPCQ